jgi:NADPH:quinone reductase-like Zn-dependent oxidoreductase
MRAVVQDRYGPVDEVLHLREVPVPEVADDEILVRVCAASAHPDVWHVVTTAASPCRAPQRTALVTICKE